LTISPCTTVGTVGHLAAFGFAAYMLGDAVDGYIARIGFGWIGAAVVALFGAGQGVGYYRRRRGRRRAEHNS